MEQKAKPTIRVSHLFEKNSKQLVSKQDESKCLHQSLLSPKPFAKEKSRCATESEEKRLLSSLKTMSSLTGLSVAFSTNDFTEKTSCSFANIRSNSDSMITALSLKGLDPSSRSISTWVTYGENSITSELPSPQVSTTNLAYSVFKKVPRLLFF